MDSATAATTTSHDDDWELRNDDGFVYKLKKRRIDPSESQPPPSTDAGAAAEEYAGARRRERKKRTLLKLKAKYESEIRQWDNLSNRLRAMQDRAAQLQREREQTPEVASSSSSEMVTAVDSVGGTVLDELLLQVEAQEAIIHDFSNLCDVAEAMCNKQEEQFKQSLFNLPVWASPLELMKFLCDD